MAQLGMYELLTMIATIMPLIPHDNIKPIEVYKQNHTVQVYRCGTFYVPFS